MRGRPRMRRRFTYGTCGIGISATAVSARRPLMSTLSSRLSLQARASSGARAASASAAGATSRTTFALCQAASGWSTCKNFILCGVDVKKAWWSLAEKAVKGQSGDRPVRV